MADLNVPDVLRRAADVVTERGLAHRAWSTPSGRVCALGAVAIACGLHSSVWQDSAARRTGCGRLADEAAEALSDYLETQQGRSPWPYDPVGVVAPWSDKADAATVAAAMRAAAEEAAA